MLTILFVDLMDVDKNEKQKHDTVIITTRESNEVCPICSETAMATGGKSDFGGNSPT